MQPHQQAIIESSAHSRRFQFDIDKHSHSLQKTTVASVGGKFAAQHFSDYECPLSMFNNIVRQYANLLNKRTLSRDKYTMCAE